MKTLRDAIQQFYWSFHDWCYKHGLEYATGRGGSKECVFCNKERSDKFWSVEKPELERRERKHYGQAS